MLPNFIIAGGVATGTSFLSVALRHHPDIYLPKVERPEPNFFHYSWKFKRGIDWYQETWFHGVGTQRAVGERSSLLLTSDVAAKRIKETLPDVKLVFCLRNPIERAWGNYRFTVLEGLEPLSFDEAIRCEPDRIRRAADEWAEVQPHAYLTRSRYSTHIYEFLTLFGEERVLLLKSEALGREPLGAIKRVCEFLDVDPNLSLPLSPNYSSPSILDRAMQMQLRQHFGDRFPELVECIRREEDVSDLIVAANDAENIDRLRANLRGGKEPLPEATRNTLRQIFADEITCVKSLVDFPVDDWM
ncbi:MAG: sulfotransferase domain-containing protein [Gammaproteobacteria bacterium]|nr:sulfotransferase domain-containing protein [Gammaproteobacteria bacterium]